MKRGSIKTKISSSGQISIQMDLIEGTAWMSKPEIANLFMVYQNTIHSNLSAIFKTEVLRNSEVVKEYRYTENSQERIAVYYNLEVIIALCYRINSPVTNALRKHILKNIVRNPTNCNVNHDNPLLTYSLN